MDSSYISRIYAGWLGKIIGIRLGAPIEGWTYEKIRNIYGELDHYPVEFHDFAADDDSNGPIFFIRALEDKARDHKLTANDVAEALLNYAPYEHGFFWWGGYGVATEHTAYLNLRHGIPAPKSGSIEMNGNTIAEQIGGQIFIDTWGLVNPAKPERAAEMAALAASVTHDGNGIYGGVFVATCISEAFVESDIRKVIEKGLSFIPENSEYSRVARDVMKFHDEYPDNWRDCYDYIFRNYGYDKYPGNCHIIPNMAVMVLAMMYGASDFSDTINICNMCGWDTDCNVGNVGAIMGVLCGIEGIDYYRWRKPINDFLACSSVVGSLNIQDIPYGAMYLTKLAYILDGDEIEEPWKEIIEGRIHSCHFELTGSTHGLRMRVERRDSRSPETRQLEMINTDETAAIGTRSLKVMAKPMEPGEDLLICQKTYYTPSDFHDSRYDPAFSPIAYPGQTVHGYACIPEYGTEGVVCLYAKEAHGNTLIYGDKIELIKGKWHELNLEIPAMESGLIEEIGFCFSPKSVGAGRKEFIGLIDELYVDGTPSYSIDFANENEEVWHVLHKEISQFTRLKGLTYLEEGRMHLSCADFGEMYTGGYNWNDYNAEFHIIPEAGDDHYVSVRVQGAIRSYSAGLMPDGRFAILKNENGYRVLADAMLDWEHDREYIICVKVYGNRIEASCEGITLTVLDEDNPYLTGAIGISVRDGSHISCGQIRVSI